MFISSLLVTSLLFSQAGAQRISVRNIANQLPDGRWDWILSLQAEPSLLARIRCVTYHLDSTFTNSNRIVCDPGTPDQAFSLHEQSWGEFQIPIDISFKDGKDTHLNYALEFRRTTNARPAGLHANSVIASFGQPTLVRDVVLFAASPDGKLVTTVDTAGGVAVLGSDSVQTAAQRTTIAALFKSASGLSNPITPVDIAFTEDGKAVMILFSRPTNVDTSERIWNCIVWDYADGSVAPLNINRPFGQMSNASFDTGTSWAVLENRSEGKISSYVAYAPGLYFERTVPSPSAAMAFAVDGNRLAYADVFTRKIIVGNVSHYSKQTIWSTTWGVFPVTSLAFSRDGGRILVATRSRVVKIIKVGSLESAEVTFQDGIARATFTPDDNGILALTNSGSLRLVRSLTHPNESSIVNDHVSIFRLSRDGSVLAALETDHRLLIRPVTYSDIHR